MGEWLMELVCVYVRTMDFGKEQEFGNQLQGQPLTKGLG